MTHPSGRLHRCSCLWPKLTSAGSAGPQSVRADSTPLLGSVKRPLVLPDDDRFSATTQIGKLGEQCSGLRSAPPCHRPTLAGVEELRHDHPVPAHQRLRLFPLPRSRRHQVLPVLRRHPPVNREPLAPARRETGNSAIRTHELSAQSPTRKNCQPRLMVPGWPGLPHDLVLSTTAHLG